MKRTTRGSGLATLALIAALAACASSDDDSPTEPHVPADRACPDTAGIARSTSGAFGALSVTPERRVVLMGGSTEVDPASRDFVEAANGGDVVVLRASGSTTSYNGYFFTDLGADPAPSSVTTLRIDDASLSSSRAVTCFVKSAEAVWLAGGDQWDYVGAWSERLHEHIRTLSSRAAAVGGTSAGAMVLGEAAFDASRGSVVSAEALADPLDADVSVSLSPLAQPELAGWIVDSHFREREREGRLLAFMARMLPLTSRDTVFGIGLDERASIVIEDDGFTVMAGAGRSAWLYRLIGPAPMAIDQPLDLDLVERVQLMNGASGPWPPSFDVADSVHVVDGVITNGIGP